MDDIWERHEARLALFESLDRYIELAKEYREWKYERDTEITEGTAEDLEYRYQDYIKTTEGDKLHRLMVLVRDFYHPLFVMHSRYHLYFCIFTATGTRLSANAGNHRCKENKERQEQQERRQ